MKLWKGLYNHEKHINFIKESNYNHEFKANLDSFPYEKQKDKSYFMLEHDALCDQNKVSQAQIEPGQKLINLLSKGDYFGELSLISKMSRTCTVKSALYSTFATLTKNQFDRLRSEGNLPEITNEYFDDDTKLINRFIANIPFLQNIARPSLVRKVFLIMQDTNFSASSEIL